MERLRDKWLHPLCARTFPSAANRKAANETSDYKGHRRCAQKCTQSAYQHIRPQCLFSSVVSTYRYNTVSFCKTKKSYHYSHPCSHKASQVVYILPVWTPATCSPWASTSPNGRHFEGLKHLWIYIYIYLYVISYTNKQLDSKVRSQRKIK